MTCSNQEIEKLLPRLLLDDNDSRREALADIDEKYISDAKGINVDYIFYIENLKNTEFSKARFRIEPLYAEIFSEIKKMFDDVELYSVQPIIDFISKTDIPKISKILSVETRQEYFNYCIGLSDRYVPIIPLDISHKLHSTNEKSLLLEQVYLDEKNKIGLDTSTQSEKSEKTDSLQKKYLNNKTELKKELCNYIMLWIHAYRFLKARQQLLSTNKNVVAFSHRYQGWSKPRQKINEVLEIEFKSNFGYGNSSYFYLILVYRGVQIYPFMDWINYKYAEASEMEGYSERFHKKKIYKRVFKGKKVSTKEVVIEQSYWEDAFDSLVKACNICERSPEEFIDTYIVIALKKLISNLEEIIDEDDRILDKAYRDFDFKIATFDAIEGQMKQAKSMNVKGSMISKTLDFIGDITKLEEVAKVSSYIDDIESLNKRILPMLEKSILSYKEVMDYLEERYKNFEKEIIDIWKNQGLEGLTQKNKAQSLSVEESILFQKLQDKHSKISKLKGEAQEDLGNGRRLLKSIERYIINIKTYFNTNK